MKTKEYEQEMRILHGELVAMQEWVKATMREAVVGTKGATHAPRDLQLATGNSVRSEIQWIAWEKCGIVRSGEGLREAREQLEALTPQSPEERSIQQVALLIARCALSREESRGAHAALKL